jgi:hypothetical protein
MQFITEGLIPLLGMMLSFAAAIWIVLIVTRSRQRKLEIQAELQSKLIEKFGSTAELVAFLQSSAGQQFVSGVQSSKGVRDITVVGIRRAIILSFLGAGFITLWLIVGVNVGWPGVLFLSLGIGYFVASLVTSRMAESDVKLPQTPPQV